jgi:hypothetical protein
LLLILLSVLLPALFIAVLARLEQVRRQPIELAHMAR